MKHAISASEDEEFRDVVARVRAGDTRPVTRLTLSGPPDKFEPIIPLDTYVASYLPEMKNGHVLRLDVLLRAPHHGVDADDHDVYFRHGAGKDANGDARAAASAEAARERARAKLAKRKAPPTAGRLFA